MALSSRLAVSDQICYYPAGYPVLSSRISGIIWPDIRYYPAGYPVRQLAGYPNPAVKNCRISGIRLSGFVSISRISGIRLSGKITIRYIPSHFDLKSSVEFKFCQWLNFLGQYDSTFSLSTPREKIESFWPEKMGQISVPPVTQLLRSKWGVWIGGVWIGRGLN